MALGVGLCNNGFMHHGNPPLPLQPSLPGVGWGSCPGTEELAGTLVPGAFYGGGKLRPRESKWWAGGCPACPWVSPGWMPSGPVLPFPTPPAPFFTDGDITSGGQWGPRWLVKIGCKTQTGCEVKSMDFLSPSSLMGCGLPGWAVRVDDADLAHGHPGRRGVRGDRGRAGCEHERKEARRGLAPQMPHSSPHREKHLRGRGADGPRWSWGRKLGRGREKMVPLTPFSVNTEVILCVPGLLLRTLHVVMSFILGAIDPLMLV